MKIGRHFVYVCIALLYPGLTAWAVGLGDLTVKSSLNAPLKAEINILNVDQTEIGDLQASLALATEFESAAIPQVSQLGGLEFTPALRDDGGAIVVVTSSEPISEPYLRFLVALEWNTGRIVREYAVLIDPPIYGKTTPAKISGPEIPSFALTTNSTRRATFSLDANGQSWSYGPVQRGDYLIAIAKMIEVPDGVSIYQLLYSLFLNNSHAFINSNMNLLKAGVVLDIPDIGVVEGISRVLAMETFTRHVIKWQEYRARFVNLGDATDQLEERVAGMGLMQETVEELEREILILRTELDESNADNLRQGRELLEATDNRNKLLDDINRLQNARDELLKTIDDMSISSVKDNQSAGMGLIQETVEELEREILILRTELDESNADNLRQGRELLEATDNRNKLLDDINRLQNARDELLKTISPDLVEVNARDSTSLGAKNVELQGQVRLLEGRIAEVMALIKTQDEELAVARQQVAVYGAALEALESVDTNVVSQSSQDKPSEQTKKADALAATVSEDEKVAQTSASKPDAGLQDVNFLVGAYSESRLGLLVAFSAIALLLMLFILLRLRRLARLRVDQETPNIIVSDSSRGKRTLEPAIANQVDKPVQSESSIDPLEVHIFDNPNVLIDSDLEKNEAEVQQLTTTNQSADIKHKAHLESLPSDQETEVNSQSLDFDLEEEMMSTDIEKRGGSSNTSESSESPGMATKLDLARAYFEMGDHQMARELLREVEHNGEQDEQEEARALKENLGL